MITVYESERLFKLLRDKNNRQPINGASFTFDISNQEVKLDSKSYSYTGRKEAINILPRLLKKYADNKAFEPHLQAYITQNIGRNKNHSLDSCLLNGLPLTWIGNEVSCGVGMQRIDIVLSVVQGRVRILIPIELKAVEATTENVIQLQRYVEWVEQYYIPNRVSDIQPALISKRIDNKSQPYYRDIVGSFKEFNKRNPRCLPLKYIEYELTANNLVFKEEKY